MHHSCGLFVRNYKVQDVLPLNSFKTTSLTEHLDHYPYYLASREVSSISIRYPSFC